MNPQIWDITFEGFTSKTFPYPGTEEQIKTKMIEWFDQYGEKITATTGALPYLTQSSSGEMGTFRGEAKKLVYDGEWRT